MTSTFALPTPAAPAAPVAETPDMFIPGIVVEGHGAVFGEWARISSAVEGVFMERIAAGAFRDALTADALSPTSSIKIQINHGHDSIGMQPIGKFTLLEEDSRGLHYRAKLFNTAAIRDLVPGLAAGQYGASFQFSVLIEDVNPHPGRSAHNPRGLMEKTLEQVALREVGPCVWGAYSGATAGIRQARSGAIRSPSARPQTSRRHAVRSAGGGWYLGDRSYVLTANVKIMKGEGARL
ncbi:MAG TPA: HK97 family phage prohead protease [Gaiellaceae bacterium]|nr:HK97 family phage prohead protease [Gaiellaceae bacterium]